MVFFQIFKYNVKKNDKVMKLSFLLIFFMLVQVTATSYSQAISLDVKNTEIRQVIKTIEQQSEYRFFYTDGLVDLAREVSLTVNGQDIEKVLIALLENTQLGFRIVENKLVMLAPKEAMIQGIPITGTVIDDTGEPLPGVTIIVKGTSTGTTSDVNGAYSINVPNTDAVLVFSFVGFATVEMAVGDNRVISVISL